MAPDTVADHDPGLELLERALAYTRGVLVDLTDADLDRPTPCRGWDVDRLLDHMVDALDAFTEAATGQIRMEPVPPTLQDRVQVLQHTACALLGTWMQSSVDTVELGDAAPGTHAVSVGREVLVRVAALEITVHGWDLARATGRGPALPAALAEDLLGVARGVVPDDARAPEFGPALDVPDRAPDDVRLLAHLGRAA